MYLLKFVITQKTKIFNLRQKDAYSIDLNPKIMFTISNDNHILSRD